MQDSFDFSKKSRRAIVIFTFLFCILAIVPRALFLFQAKSAPLVLYEDYEPFHYVKKVYSENSRHTYSREYERFKKPPVKFDPSKYSINQWVYLGLSEKQASAMVRFSQFGIHSEKALGKAFVLPKKLFDLIKDSCLYTPVNSPSDKILNYDKKSSIESKATSNSIVELNSASLSELESLKGIGPFFAKNIIKLRDKLGGFYDENQLLEVWQFTPEKLKEISNQISISKQLIVPLNINSVSSEELKNHPYFTWNIANSLIKMRAQKGRFNSLNELKESVLVTEEWFQKIKIYLSL